MDYVGLSAALIARVRGSMSQEHLSRRLGYSSNVLYLWERGRRLPTVGAFFRLAELRRHPVHESVDRFASAWAGAEGLGPRVRPVAVPQLMRWMAGEQSSVDLARLTGFDRTTIGRWLAGKTEPRLPDFLAFLDKATLRLLEFVALFTNPAELAATREAYEASTNRQALAYEQPWSHAVLHALELDAYRRLPRHRPAVLAEHLGLTSAAVEEHLARLHAAHVIEKRDGIWREVRKLSIDTRADFARNRQLKQHWAAVVLERLGRHEPRHQSLFSYNVFPIARAELAQLRELHIEYFQRVRQLVAGATGADHVVVMNIQLCALDEAPR
jgi:transcriptional regulator with XRE-family HTH domain